MLILKIWLEWLKELIDLANRNDSSYKFLIELESRKKLRESNNAKRMTIWNLKL